MAKPTAHLVIYTKDLIKYAACGAQKWYYARELLTQFPLLVTCERCKRTKAYQETREVFSMQEEPCKINMRY